MIQTQLVSGSTYTTAWLARDSRVKVGTRISLKGDKRVWVVERQGFVLDSSLIHQDWKVGGL